jgi:hypothetical protein
MRTRGYHLPGLIDFSFAWVILKPRNADFPRAGNASSWALGLQNTVAPAERGAAMLRKFVLLSLLMLCLSWTGCGKPGNATGSSSGGGSGTGTSSIPAPTAPAPSFSSPAPTEPQKQPGVPVQPVEKTPPGL